ncbi:MAG: MFS transporter [Verrucomicrobia bacterium]|nr:MFS transporter [Verrucomicrobiota bacterium]
MVAQSRTELTYRYERWRAISSGVLETAGTTFLLLLAVRWFEAGPLAKAFVAGGGSLGLILAPWVVSRVEAAGWPVAKAASRLAALGAISFFMMALVPLLPVFVVGSVLAMTTASAAIPLMTQIYQENYPEHERGRRFSRTVMIRIATAAAFSELAGRALSGHLNYFQWLLVVFSGAFAFASICLARCPSQPLHVSGGTHPFRALRHVRDDRLFRQTLIAWMFLGFATLMMAPLRVEYLANAKYGMTQHGLPLTAGKIALLTGVIPNLARLVLSPVWGWLFDRMNFFVLRITLNIGFALGILSFFTSGTMTGLVVAAIIYGISNAGGDVAWSLWVTKFAPPRRVADYMSVHTFFTGVRGVLAPLVAFQLVSGVSMQVLGWISAGLIVAGTSMLIPEIKFGKGARQAAALVEEVSE